MGDGRMQFAINSVELTKFLREKTNLFERFSAKEGSKNVTDDDAFLDFCIEMIEDQAQEIHSVRIAFMYYDDVDCYHADVMEYQGVFFVQPGPEHDPIGYFFKKDEAIAAADQFASEVYDGYAEEEYQRMQQENNQV